VEVGDRVVNGDKSLQMTGRFEPLHDLLASPRRQMGVLRPVVQAFVLAMLEGDRQVDEMATMSGYPTLMIKTSKSIYRGYRFPAEVMSMRFGSISGFPSACEWSKTCWRQAGSPSATRPCGAGRRNSNGSTPTKSVGERLNSGTSGISTKSWSRSTARSIDQGPRP